jgi:pyrroloquinoline quinone (PQQ) biosynthesis protein C
MQGNQTDIIELLAIHEEKISQLYKTYADKFPDYKDFWNSLSEEEKDHAKLIRELKAKIQERTVTYDRERLRISIIQRSMDYLEDQLNRAQKKEMTLINALSIALDLEKSIIDERFSKD